MTDMLLWQSKLHARLSALDAGLSAADQATRSPEGCALRQLHEILLPDGVPVSLQQNVARAASWAADADRAAFPGTPGGGSVPDWQHVPPDEASLVIHPLSGAEYQLPLPASFSSKIFSTHCADHFRTLVHDGDPRKTALALWRFGPMHSDPMLRRAWGLLPADPRMPDHTAWDSLDLTAALASAFALDGAGVPALLAVSIGPVQDFIAASRSTSDLWAGSHLLSSMSWEAMRIVCEEVGPEAVLFPRLRGTPVVDLWLRDACGLRPEFFESFEWANAATDSNPLFAAALPNRFTALVPADRAAVIGKRIAQQLQHWVLEQGIHAYRLLLQAAAIDDSPGLPGYQQLERQLAGFPEVHWASVPWSLATDEGHVQASDARLADALRPFFQVSQPAAAPGYLASETWCALRDGIALEGGDRWEPSPGALYPALHELLERLLAATKTLRPFEQLEEEGWRCTLSGEVEWLTTEREQLSRGLREREDTLWARVARNRPAWARKGEHLGARATLKRLWPSIFIGRVNAAVGRDDVRRFVVSTHTMALAGALGRWASRNERMPKDLVQRIERAHADRVALPRRTARLIAQHPDAETLAQLPGWFELSRGAGAEESADATDADAVVRRLLGNRPEAYYGLMLMDGDRLGAWVSGGPDTALPHAASFAPSIRRALESGCAAGTGYDAYARSLRSGNPARQMAVADALANFTLMLGPDIVEQRFNGRILYAGGDDLMAMLPVTDLLPAMAALRAAYSGDTAETVGANPEDTGFKRLADGIVAHGHDYLRLMGERATASMGVVIAHHQAPLNLVLSELRAAEQRAKREGLRDAFSITVLKRSGGALHLTTKWKGAGTDPPMTCLIQLASAMKEDGASRRAAYNVHAWLVDLPGPQRMGEAEYRLMLRQLMAYQFKRQGLPDSEQHAERLSSLAPVQNRKMSLEFINNFLAVADFFARQGRGQP